MCGKDITESRNVKYCCQGCSMVAFHTRHGVKVYAKKCKCGCEDYIVSRSNNIKRDYIRGHNKEAIPGKPCSLCGVLSEELIVYEMTRFDMDLCEKCIENIKKENKNG